MPELLVQGGQLSFQGKTYRCAVGKGGVIAATQKREGDGATPAGSWKLRECWFRHDRLAMPNTMLPTRAIQKDDGWCDDSAHPLYNHHIRLPFEARHETLWRDDHTYDLIVPLGYNDNPVVAGKGSAIFLHVAKPGYAGTEGCVALAQEDLLSLLPFFTPELSISIATG